MATDTQTEATLFDDAYRLGTLAITECRVVVQRADDPKKARAAYDKILALAGELERIAGLCRLTSGKWDDELASIVETVLGCFRKRYKPALDALPKVAPYLTDGPVKCCGYEEPSYAEIITAAASKWRHDIAFTLWGLDEPIPKANAWFDAARAAREWPYIVPVLRGDKEPGYRFYEAIGTWGPFKSRNDLFRDAHERHGYKPPKLLNGWNSWSDEKRAKLVPDDSDRIPASKGEEREAALDAIRKALKYKPAGSKPASK